jgi:uncharacterized protein (TIGR02246 family)
MPAIEEDEIKRIFEVVQPSRVRTGDVAGYASQFAADATWSPPNAPDQRGPEAIEAALAATLAKMSIDPVFTADAVYVCGEQGYVFGRSTENIHPTDGSPSSVAYSRELWVFERIDTEWKIAHMLWNLKPGPA